MCGLYTPIMLIQIIIIKLRSDADHVIKTINTLLQQLNRNSNAQLAAKNKLP